MLNFITGLMLSITGILDLRASKAFETPFGNLEIVLTVQNLTNNKWLNTGNMSPAQYDEYKTSLLLLIKEEVISGANINRVIIILK